MTRSISKIAMFMQITTRNHGSSFIPVCKVVVGIYQKKLVFGEFLVVFCGFR